MNKLAKITLWVFSFGALAIAVVGLFSLVGRGTTIYSSSDDEMMGFIDVTGREVIAAKYYDAKDFSEGLAAVMGEERLYGYIDQKGKMVIKPQFDAALKFSEGLAGVRHQEDGNLGYIDKTGKVVIETKFNSISSFSDGMAVVEKLCEDDEVIYGFVDKEGRFIVPQYNDAKGFSEGLAAVAIGDHHGYIDKTGQMVIEPQFAEAYSFSDGLARVAIVTKNEDDIEERFYGYIDKTGQMVIEAQYELADDFSEGLAPVMNEEGLYGYIDKTGRMVIEPQFNNAYVFSDGMAKVGIEDEEDEGTFYGYIDKSGQMVIKPQFEMAESFSEGLASVKSDSLKAWVFIDKTGKVVIGRELLDKGYEATWGFHDGLSRGNKGIKYGLSNWLGIHKTKPIYREIETVSNGLFMAETNDGYCLLNKRGKVLLTGFDYAFDFSDKFVEVRINGLSGLVDRKGKWVVEPQYEAMGIYYEDSDRAWVKKDGLYGYINGEGNLVIDINYDVASSFDEGTAQVEIDDKSKLIDTDGNLISEGSDDEDEIGVYLMAKGVVEIFENNPLDPMPKELEPLVAETDVDLRNSLYSIVKNMPDDDDWMESTYFDKDDLEHFIDYNIIVNMVGDPAIYNVFARDFDNCVRFYGAEYIEENGNPCYDSIEGWGPTWKSRFIEPLLASERLQNILFTWTKPMLKHAFSSECSLSQQMYITSAVNYMINYTAHYDHQAEKDFYRLCVAEGVEYLFNSTSYIERGPELKFDYDMPSNPYRKLETWVYRRVEEQSMSAAQIHDWLVRIKAELNLGGLQENFKGK